MLQQLTNFGEPIIAVEDANHDNRGELLLSHRHEGEDLRLDHAQATLEGLYRLWRRPVCLATQVEGKACQLRWDGETHGQRD